MADNKLAAIYVHSKANFIIKLPISLNATKRNIGWKSHEKRISFRKESRKVARSIRRIRLAFITPAQEKYEREQIEKYRRAKNSTSIF